MTQHTPSIDLTIFPRINFLQTFDPRAIQRDINGRIFLPYGAAGIDDPNKFPPSDGSDCLANSLPFPIYLGPLVPTIPTGLVDLRNSCGNPTSYDLNPLN